MKRFVYFFTLFFLVLTTLTYSQNKPVTEMTREEVLAMTYEQLADLSFDELLKLADIVGVSLDELYEMLLNPEQSIASKKTENKFVSPLSTSVITKEDIAASGATSIQELFRIVPGVIVREKSNGNFDLHIRGNDNVPPGNFSHFSENNLTLVMIDGRVVYNYVNGGTFWESLPISLTDIDQIEIIRGPSTALYGPNAVSGVINIITKQPYGEKIAADANVTFGSNNQQMVSGNVRKKINNKFGFAVNMNYEKRDREQDDYYSFLTGNYVKKENLVSLFGVSYLPEKLPTPDLAVDRYGGNLALFFNPNTDIAFDLSAGLQASEVQTAFFENLATPFANRETETSYLNLNSSFHNFKAHVAYTSGIQDLSVGMVKPVIKYDMQCIQADLEYDFVLGEFNLRPGISYQNAIYDDSKYVEEAQKDDSSVLGLLNGENNLSSFAYSLRADYLAFEKFRLIAAVRADKYNKPDKTYFSYQFITSYNANDRLLLRGVYSRANRGAFIGNVYSDFKNPLGDKIVPGLNYFQYYIGNEDLDLLSMDMFEVGLRAKPIKNIMIDVEAFYSITSDFDALFTDSTYVDYATMSVHEKRKYNNIDIKSKQFGITANLDFMFGKKIKFNVFGTWQKTSLENFAPDLDNKPDSTINFDHEWTPSFYGGMGLHYTPNDKISIYSNAYFYTEQDFLRYQTARKEKNQTTIESKFIWDMKVAYKIWRQNSVFVGINNILNDDKVEFAFTDNVSRKFTAGLSIKF